MNKTHHIFLLLFLFLTEGVIFSQRPDTLWMRTYGGKQMDNCFNLYYRNNHLILGGSLGTPDGIKCYLLETNTNGEETRNTTYKSSNPQSPQFMLAEQDGSFTFLGITEESDPYTAYGDILLVKFNSDFELEMAIKSGNSMYSEGATAMAKTVENGYLIVGSEWVDGTSAYDIVVYRINSVGVIETKKQHGFGTALAEYAGDIIQTSDGNYVITGQAQNGEDNYTYNTIILKVDPTGNILSKNLYGLPSPKDEMGNSVFQTSDGGLLIAGVQKEGTIYLECEVIKTDKDGAVEWDHVYGGIYNDAAYNAIETSDGNYIACGTYHDVNWKAIVMKYNADGDTLWTYKLGNSGYNLRAFDIVELDDGDIVIAGTTTTDTSSIDIFMARLHESSSGIYNLRDKDNHIQMKIYPDPVNELLHMKAFFAIKTEVQIEIYNLLGETVKSVFKGKLVGEYKTDIHIPNLETGIYFVRVKTNYNSKTHKIIIK